MRHITLWSWTLFVVNFLLLAWNLSNLSEWGTAISFLGVVCAIFCMWMDYLNER